VILKDYYCGASVKVLSTLSGNMVTAVLLEFYHLGRKAFSILKFPIKILCQRN